MFQAKRARPTNHIGVSKLKFDQQTRGKLKMVGHIASTPRVDQFVVQVLARRLTHLPLIKCVGCLQDVQPILSNIVVGPEENKKNDFAISRDTFPGSCLCQGSLLVEVWSR